MKQQSDRKPNFRAHPLTPARWGDFEALFGPKGACAGCWCMWWRIRRAEWEKNKGEGNKQAMRQIVTAGEIAGLIGYLDGEAAAWCSIAPRHHYPVLARSRVLKPVDQKPVWSITCLFVKKELRRSGISGRLIHAAIDYAGANGATTVEAYPIDTTKDYPDAFAGTGFVSAFQKAGFVECVRRSDTRPILRYEL